MAYAFWQVVAETPWWTYCLFFFIFSLAQNARQPRIVPLPFLSIIPCIFTMLSVFVLYNFIKFEWLTAMIWTGGCMAGTVLGWLQFRMLGIKGIKNSRSVYIPGTNTLFIITLLALGGDYYVRYHMDFSPAELLSTHVYWLVLIYGTLAGLFMGRLMLAIWRVIKGPHVTFPEESSADPALSTR